MAFSVHQGSEKRPPEKLGAERDVGKVSSVICIAKEWSYKSGTAGSGEPQYVKCG